MISKDDIQIGKRIRIYDGNKKDYIEGVVEQLSNDRFFILVEYDTILEEKITNFLSVHQSFAFDYWIQKNRIELL